MKFLRLLPLLALVVLLGGCTALNGRSKVRQHYRKITVTDNENKVTAEWVAEGNVRSHARGYIFTAVQRTSGPPYVTTSHYPNGWKVRIDGIHITVGPCRKPDWLQQLDGF